MTPAKCPHCNTPWQEEETIYEYFLRQGKSEEEARESASLYGCTKGDPKHFSKDVIGIEDRDKYDGVSYWQCQKCKTTFDRFIMKEVKYA